MSDLSLPVLLGFLAALLLISALFCSAEMAMKGASPHRLRRQAGQDGHRGAKLALALLEKSDRLMGLLLFAKTLTNVAAATLSACVALLLVADTRWALAMGAISITVVLLIFSEIPAKAIGVAYADKIAPVVSYFLIPLLHLATPIIWFANLCVRVLLRLFRVSPRQMPENQALTPAELRNRVLESAGFIPAEQRAIFDNLLDLDVVSVEDVMTPRSAIEILDLSQDWDGVFQQLSTSHHGRLPVCRESLDGLLGVLTIRRLIGAMQHGELDEASLRAQLQAPYYIPAGTPAIVQLSFFQENRQRIGFVIDEYGEILGLLVMQDIIDEIVGRFTSVLPAQNLVLAWDAEDCAVVDGARSLREINRLLGLDFAVDGPKTLNGLILEHFQDIPETGVSFKIAGVQVEVLQTQDRSVRTAKLFRPQS
ncbi:MAG: CBS:Protein of unknown function DUF21:Transporter-associated region [Proteobacteria bacterium]|nr:CBS:Protein of unknown function DUF21:Transporter-associated region [Pseudomonadota bacterium]